MTTHVTKPARVLVVAPHADDETIGAGGTLLRHAAAGDEVHWCIATGMDAGAPAFAGLTAELREQQITRVASMLGIAGVHRLGFPAAKLCEVSEYTLVSAFSEVVRLVEPEEVYVCHGGDIHGDHRATFQAVVACSKWFRFPSIRRLLAYETLSETDAAAGLTGMPFVPNVFVDITKQLEGKLEAARVYASELGVFPFPRSEAALVAQARLRGCMAGFEAAEAFMLLRERRR